MILERWWKKINKVDQPIGRDKKGIEIWNRSGRNVLESLFVEDFGEVDFVRNYAFHPAGIKFEQRFKDGYYDEPEMVPDTKMIGRIGDFFVPGVLVLEAGCGGGQAAVDMAGKFKKTSFLAIDHEMGGRIKKPFHWRSNLRFENMDWDNLSLGDDTVDRILSRQGVTRYGSEKSAVELTRVAKEGAILRGDLGKGVYGRKSFTDYLYESGWDVYSTQGIVVARKKISS